MLWTTAIAATLYMTVMWRKRIEDTWLTWAKFSAWCFGVPLLLTIIPGAAGAFGAAGSECWIKESKWGWRFGVFYVPLWLCVAFNGECSQPRGATGPSAGRALVAASALTSNSLPCCVNAPYMRPHRLLLACSPTLALQPSATSAC